VIEFCRSGFEMIASSGLLDLELGHVSPAEEDA
jgi:hypothetical protein